MHRVEKTPVSLAQMVLKEKGILHSCFFQWLHQKPPSPLLWAFFCSSVQSKWRTPHAMLLHKLMSHLLKIQRNFICWLQPKLCFPSLVLAADSKSPQPHKVTSHLKLFLWECCRPPRSTGSYSRYCHPALLYPFPPSQLKKSHLETRDYKLPLPVIPLLCVHTAPNTSDLTGVLSL